MHLFASGPLVAAAIAAGGFACWFALLGVMVLATRSPRPRPGPTADPTRPDAESPAVVDLLTGGWRLCEEAAAATVLDLAARRLLAIEEIGPELSLVRLRRGEVTGLTAYERRVYEHLCRLAVDGVVATGALAEGTRNLTSWWKGFTAEVIEESRARGLSRRRWTAGHLSVLSAAAVLPAALAAITVFVSATDDDRFGAALGAGVLVFAALLGLAQRCNGEQGTARGVEVAGRWLGLREHLSAGRFAEQPAAAVTVWGRPLAYAAALGLAPRSVVSLSVASAADDRRAWSDHGGMWHQVEVRYRARGPLGVLLWGRGAWSALGVTVLIGLGTFVVSLVALTAGGWLLGLEVGNPVPAARTIAVLVAAVPLGMAVTDLFSRPVVEGQVVRSRRYQRSGGDDNVKYHHWIALDTGTSRRVVAYGADGTTWSRLQEGDVVRARVGRWLGHLYAVEVITPSRHRTGTVGPRTPGPDPV